MTNCTTGNAYSKLTKEDICFIRDYIKMYGDVCISTDSIEGILHEWNRCKSNFLLDKVFGGNLRMRFSMHVMPEEEEVINDLRNVYRVPYFPICNSENGFNEYFKVHAEDETTNVFVWSFISFMSSKISMMDDNIMRLSMVVRRFAELIKYSTVITNTVPYDMKYEVKKNGEIKSILIPAGSKTIKAIGNLLKNVGYDNMELFNSWKDAVSVCTTVKERDVDLVLSIHPIDFMMMSDNDCGWRSCMCWDGGEYSCGTIEMMNSPYAIVGYIEDSENPTISRCGMDVPNKEWRCLFFVTDRAVISGKAYPYRNDSVAMFGVNVLREIAEDVFDHEYTSVQRYTDMEWYYNHYDGNDMGSRWVISELYKDDSGWTFDFGDDIDDDEYADMLNDEFDRKIVVCVGDFMYNDFFESCNYQYYIAKDARPFDFTCLDLGGGCTCLCCGDFMDSDSDCGKKFCARCEEQYYCIDDKLHPDEELYEFKILNEFGEQKATYDMAVDMLWYRPGLDIFSRKDASTVKETVFFLSNRRQLENIAFTHPMRDSLLNEDFGDDGIECRLYERAFVYSHLKKLKEMYTPKPRYFITLADVDEFDRMYAAYHEVKEVDIDDEEQNISPVCV